MNFLPIIDLYTKHGHQLSGFKPNCGVYIAQCDKCLDHAIVNPDLVVLDSLYQCTGDVPRSKFHVPWTQEDQERFQRNHGGRFDKNVNWNYAFNGSAKRPKKV